MWHKVGFEYEIPYIGAKVKKLPSSRDHCHAEASIVYQCFLINEGGAAVCLESPGPDQQIFPFTLAQTGTTSIYTSTRANCDTS